MAAAGYPTLEDIEGGVAHVHTKGGETNPLPCNIAPYFSLAFSGGGIRSAAEASGVLCYLKMRRILNCVTAMSSVSGGGYTATSYMVWRKEHGQDGDWVYDYLRQMSRNAGYCCNWSEGFIRGTKDLISTIGILLISLVGFILTYGPLSWVLCYALATYFRGYLLDRSLTYEIPMLCAAVIAGASILKAVFTTRNPVSWIFGSTASHWLGDAAKALEFVLVPVAIIVGAARYLFMDILRLAAGCIAASFVIFFLVGRLLPASRAACLQSITGFIMYLPLSILQSQLLAWMVGCAPVSIGSITFDTPSQEHLRFATAVIGGFLGLFYYTGTQMRLRLFSIVNEMRLGRAFYPKKEVRNSACSCFHYNKVRQQWKCSAKRWCCRRTFKNPRISVLEATDDGACIPKIYVNTSVRNWARQTGPMSPSGHREWPSDAVPLEISGRALTRIDESMSRAPNMPPLEPHEINMDTYDARTSEVMAVSAAAVAAELGARTSFGNQLLQFMLVALGISMARWRAVESNQHPCRRGSALLSTLFFTMMVSAPCVLLWKLHWDWLAYIPAGMCVVMILYAAVGPDSIFGVPIGTASPVRILREFMNIDTWRNNGFPHQMFLSDGGHSENLGILPLLARRERHILAMDGGLDPDMSCADLFKAIHLARQYLGCTITPPASYQRAENVCPDQRLRDYLTLRMTGPHGSLAAPLKVVYADGSGGTLVYLKPRAYDSTDEVRKVYELVQARETEEANSDTDCVRNHFVEMHYSGEPHDESQIGGCCCDCCNNKLCTGTTAWLCGRYPNTNTLNQLFTTRMFNEYHRAGFVMAAAAVAVAPLPNV